MGLATCAPDIMLAGTNGSSPFKVEFQAQVLANQILLDFAADREREAVDEAHVAGYLVVRNLSAAEFTDLFLRDGHAAPQPDARAYRLAVLGVGNTHDGDVEHRRMAIKIFFDFPRINVLTAADDHILQAADDIAIALCVDHREIAGVHPAP